MLRNQMAQAGSWLGRIHGIIAAEPDCAAAGYLLIPELVGALDSGQPATAKELAARATEIASRFRDPDLAALAGLGHGQALLALGQTRTGTARLDEVMLSVASGDVGPIASGLVYCAVILEYMQILDLARAAEWTNALSAWCDAQPGLVPYRGQCLVHQSQLQQANGDWVAAVSTVESACDRLTDPPHPALGLAYYQAAELHRLTGNTEAAALAYRRASRHGGEPMPGLALLELAEGNLDGAAAGIRRVIDEPRPTGSRPALLASAVEIFVADADLDEARQAAEDLAEIAAASPSPMLAAMADHAWGSIHLAEREPEAALSRLRAAADAWQRLAIPYEAARTGLLAGLACAAMGDAATAAVEVDNARDTFAELGAGPDLRRLGDLTDGLDHRPTGGTDAGSPLLSGREREVLTLLAAGRTNREIASELVISPHTAGRHVENIFTKLGVSSRAAATAHAYEHGLL